MRIVHLTWEYPPLVYGGIARHVEALAQHQAAAGHDVTVITQQAPGSPALETVAGVRVIRVPHDPPRLAFTDSTVLSWVAGLSQPLARALVRVVLGCAPDSTPDVVHAHDWVVASAAAMAADGLALPVVTTLHATEAGRHQGWISGPTSMAVHQVEGWLAGMSSAVITCSAQMARDVAVLFPAAPTAVVIPNGIDLDAWPARRLSAADRAARVPTVLFVGRVEWEKGIFDLIDAMAILVTRRPARLRIVGAGGQVDEVRRRIQGLSLSNAVDLVGRVGPDQISDEYARADLVVAPSRYEPFGLTALEALATGVPLVVADVGGLADIAAGGRATVVPPGDPAALAKAVIAVLADSAGARARAVATRASLAADFDWVDIARRTVAVYDEALRATGGVGVQADATAAAGGPRTAAIPNATFRPWATTDPFAEPLGPELPGGRLLP